MPSGKVHAVATTLVAGTVGPAILLVGGQPPVYAVAFIAGCMAGLVLNPDLDIRHPT